LGGNQFNDSDRQMRQENRYLRRQIDLIAKRSREFVNGISRRRIRETWDRFVRASVNPEPRRSKIKSKKEEQGMAFGDSANWDGNVPPPASIWKMKFRVTWLCKDMTTEKPLELEVQFGGGQGADVVAKRVSNKWNEDNPHGRRAIYDEDNTPHKTQWDRCPSKMEVKGWKDSDSEPSYRPIPFGVKTDVFKDTGGTTYPGATLVVFNA